MLCESKFGYVYQLIINMGKDILFDDNYQHLCKSSQVVMTLIQSHFLYISRTGRHPSQQANRFVWNTQTQQKRSFKGIYSQRNSKKAKSVLTKEERYALSNEWIRRL